MAGSGPLLAALAETGAIGSTARQLAERVDRPVPDVSERLAALSDAGRVVRIGRGLWILRDFETLDGRSDFVDPEVYTERLQAEEGVSLGAYSGPITFSDNDTAPVHRWWPYVQGYSAEFVAGLIGRADLPRHATVLDPFSGSGTTVVEARRAGHRGVGAEILPPAVLASRVKTTFELSPTALERAATSCLARAERRTPGTLPFLRETRKQFPRESLERLTRLRDALPDASTPVGRAVRVAFGRILIPVSRLRRSPCLGYAGPGAPEPPEPFEALRGAISEMRADLGGLQERRERWGPPADIWEGDARSLPTARGSVDLAVTSPPYVNGMDYVMNYKLDLAWLGYATSYADLVRLRTSMVACDNLPRGAADAYLSPDAAPDPWLPEILHRIRENVARKGTYRRNDVHGIVARYFADLVPVLRRVHDALVPGGKFVVVVGDSLLAGAYVPGDLLVARLGRAQGFTIDSIEVARERRSGQRRSFRLRESIVTLAKPRSGG